MLAYLLKRLLYAIPILIGVNLITFLLFFVVNSPDDMARIHLGLKHVDQQMVDEWKQNHGYDKPLFLNSTKPGVAKLTDTLFFNKSVRLFAFDFGSSDSGRDIAVDVKTRMWPSLAIAIPTLFLELFIATLVAMMLAFFRGSYLDYGGVLFSLMLMSITPLFYIIAGQFVFAKLLKLVPISGYDTGFNAIKFLILPIVIGVLTGIGANIRWFRTLFLEEIHRDYVLAARARGLSEIQVLFKHVLKNALIPIVTNVVVIIPSLFLGSLLMESFFAIPGLGSYTIDAISQQDFAIVRAMVFLGTVVYIAGLILTDFVYTLVDPRVRFSN